MSKVKALQIKLERHQAYYDFKKQHLNQLDVTSRKWLHRYSRLLDLSNLITKLIIELNTEMMISAFADKPNEPQSGPKRRTREQIMQSKAIYRKHAERYKANDYPEHRAKRMLAYTAALNKAITLISKR